MPVLNIDIKYLPGFTKDVGLDELVWTEKGVNKFLIKFRNPMPFYKCENIRHYHTETETPLSIKPFICQHITNTIGPIKVFK